MERRGEAWEWKEVEKRTARVDIWLFFLAPDARLLGPGTDLS
jgi:hypothetical protein